MKQNSVLLLLIGGCLFLNCLYPGRDGRTNPFDPDGVNWFPPGLNIVDSCVTVNRGDTVSIRVKTSDRNGSVKYLTWISVPALINRKDSIAAWNDSLIIWDTVITTTVLSDDSIYFDSSFIDSSFDTVYTIKVNKNILVIWKKDSLHLDTLSYDSLSNISYSFFKKEQNSHYCIYKLTKHIIPIQKIILDTAIHMDSVYYLYSSSFIFDTLGSFTLFATAVDNLGIESEYEDSVIVMVEESASSFTVYRGKNYQKLKKSIFLK